MRLRFLGIIALCAYISLATANPKMGAQVQKDNLFPTVKLVTNVGDIVVELDRHKAPITVNNFLSYVVAGAYNQTVFHRVVENFVVQGGGYDKSFQPKDQFAPIFNESGNGLKNEMYTIAMARQDDPHSATNQFYFNINDNDNLDPGSTWGYTVFGVVMEGEAVIDTIGRAKTHYHEKLGWQDVPVENYMLIRVEVVEVN